MAWDENSVLVGIVIGAIGTLLVTTATGRSVVRTTGKAISTKYAQLVD